MRPYLDQLTNEQNKSCETWLHDYSQVSEANMHPTQLSSTVHHHYTLTLPSHLWTQPKLMPIRRTACFSPSTHTTRKGPQPSRQGGEKWGSGGLSPFKSFSSLLTSLGSFSNSFKSSSNPLNFLYTPSSFLQILSNSLRPSSSSFKFSQTNKTPLY